MAYAVTALYLTAVSVLLSQKFWVGYSNWEVLGGSLLLLVTSISTISFVAWQFSRRLWASDIVTVCMTLTSRWLTQPPDDPGVFQARPVARVWGASTEENVELPIALADELNRLRKCRRWPWLPRDLTFLLLGLWTLAGFAQVLISWNKEYGMVLNLWNISGLGLDVVGVLGVAIALWPGLALPQPTRILYWVAWIAVGVGLLLQLAGQFTH